MIFSILEKLFWVYIKINLLKNLSKNKTKNVSRQIYLYIQILQFIEFELDIFKLSNFKIVQLLTTLKSKTKFYVYQSAC